VRALLTERHIALAKLDTVEPPQWMPLTPGLHITIVRGYEEIVSEAIPYQERLIRDEFMSPQETYVLQPGVDGQAERRYLLLMDGAQLIERRLIERRVIAEPVTLVRVTGTRGLLLRVAVQGTLAYVANGEPWVLRRNTDGKRPLARGVQTDGRVFDLSSDGSRLLYSVGNDVEGQLNELYVAVSDVLNASPQRLGISNVHWAAWSPDGQRIAYTTFTPMRGEPGWRAANDLHVIAWPAGTPVIDLPPTAAFVYAWYGERWAWRPDGAALAYARADSVGVLDLATTRRTCLASFPPGVANDAMVPLPELAWSPDGETLAYTLPNAGATEATLHLISTQSGVDRAASAGIGRPVFARDGQRLLLAQPASGSEATLAVIDTMTQQKRALRQDAVVSLPPQLAWGPVATQFIYVYAGDLYCYDLTNDGVTPLTATGLVSSPVWR